jgi:hypothetical protein
VTRHAKDNTHGHAFNALAVLVGSGEQIEAPFLKVSAVFSYAYCILIGFV